MFDPNTLYPNDDPRLDVLGKPQTRAHWRSERVGPAFVKLGGRVFYRGEALNDWIKSCEVKPTARGPRRSHRRNAAAESRPAA